MLSTVNAPEQDSLVDFYIDVADKLNSKVFLWGALVQALVLELKEGNTFLVKGLAEKTTDNRLLHSALVEALIRFGEGNRNTAEKVILELVGQLTLPPQNFFAELVRLLRPVREDSQQVQPQKMIGVEAAMRLRLVDLLENLAVEPSPWLRNLAAQNIFYLWKQDHEAGIKILDDLSYRVRGKHGLPDLGAVESTLALIGAILGVEQRDTDTLQSLSTIARQALRRVLYLTDLDKSPTVFNRIRRAFLGIVYNLITGVVFKFILRTMGDWGDHAGVSRTEIEHFFELSPEQKQLILTFIPFIDYDEPGFEKRVKEMITVLDWGDLASGEIIGYGIMGRVGQNYEAALELAKQLVDYGLSFNPPRFWIAAPLWNFWQGATHLEHSNPDDFMRLMNRVTIAIQNDPIFWLEHTRRERAVPLANESLATNTQNHVGAYYVFTKRAEIPEVIQNYLERAIQAEDDEYIKSYIREFAGVFEMGYYHTAIAGLKPLANYKNEEIQNALINFLVRARNYDPEYMEDMLLRDEFPQEVADRVLANPTSERLTDLLSYQLVPIIYNLFVLGPKPLRSELKWLFSQGLKLHSFQDTVVFFIRDIFNLVLGEVVFSVPPDAPSRQMLKGVKDQ